MAEDRPQTESLLAEEQTAQAGYTFFVYIVESPSAPDLYHGRSEGALVANALSLDRIMSPRGAAHAEALTGLKS